MRWADLPAVQPTFDEDRDTVIRQSTINSIQLCGQRVALAGQEGYLALVSEPLAFGTCVHELCAQHMMEGAVQDSMLLNMDEWVEEILVEQYDWTISKVPNHKDFFSEIAAAYRNWVTNVYGFVNEEEPLAIELPTQLYLGEGKRGNIFLQGTADAVLHDRLVDWKTSKKDWGKTKAQFSFQPTLYAALYKQELGRALRKFDFWVYDRSKMNWNLHPTQRSIAQIDSALGVAYQYGLQLESGDLPATPVPISFAPRRGWYCGTKFCSAWNVCEFKYLEDDIDESAIAERVW